MNAGESWLTLEPCHTIKVVRFVVGQNTLGLSSVKLEVAEEKLRDILSGMSLNYAHTGDKQSLIGVADTEQTDQARLTFDHVWEQVKQQQLTIFTMVN